MPHLRPFLVIVPVLLALGGAVWWWAMNPTTPALVPTAAPNQAPSPTSVSAPQPQHAPSGTPAVATPPPASDLVLSAATTTQAVAATPPKASPPPIESAPPAPAGPTAQALADVHRTGEGAEATSPLLTPAPFDLEAFAKDPAPYLQRSVPGRVFQTAQPGPGVPVLGARGPATHEIPHGGSCDLTVRAPAGAVVTFTTFDLGLFDNGLASISVQANADGVATARFTATGEVAGDVHLLAGSPMASGQVKFLVGVLPPASRVSQTN